ncbi:hypothetical protein K438DRAFT_1862508 [Mycena galopus ATCC 62051]|nr:hypothetical protein K438DRAFT_1862508 [Mycena galopus ATCC 62051]
MQVQDLIDTIIDQLRPIPWTDPKDYATLTACSLVSRSFRGRSQGHLFRPREAPLRLKPEAVARLSDGLGESPHLASYIRALHLVDAGFWNDSDRAPLAWKDIPADFRAALFDLLALPSLRCFALARCRGIPSSIIRVSHECGHLR